MTPRSSPLDEVIRLLAAGEQLGLKSPLESGRSAGHEVAGRCVSEVLIPCGPQADRLVTGRTGPVPSTPTLRTADPALGVRVKSGWAAVVLMGGSAEAPSVLSSRRLALADPATPDTIQPYHAGTGTAQDDARVIRRLIGLIERCARANVSTLLEQYRLEGHPPRAAAVIGTSITDPATITNPHIRIHALEGQLFRRVVREALAGAGVRCAERLEQDLQAEAPAKLGRSAAELKLALKALRPASGEPWRSEQKMAALAGWILLATARA